MNIEQLVERGKTGDKFAINELIERFTPLILKLVSNIYIKGYDREDLIQIGYMSIIKAIESYNLNYKNSFTAYVSRAVRNNYNYEIRKMSKKNYEISYEKIIEEGKHLQLLKKENSLEQNIVKKEEIETLKKALSKLSRKEVELIKLSYGIGYGGLSDYSKFYGIKYGTAHKRKERILEKLAFYGR